MINKLNERERFFLVGGAVVLVVILGGYSIYETYRAAMVRLDRTIAGRTRQLTDFGHQQQQALQIRQQIQQAESKLAQSAGFSLGTYIENQAGLVAGRTALAYVRPQPPVVRGNLQEESIEAKLERLSLEQALRILWAVEAAPAPAHVQQLDLRRRFDDPGLLDMTMTVTATRRAG